MKENNERYESVRDRAYLSMDRNIFRETISKSMQKDGQKLLDALDEKNLQEIVRLHEKYAQAIAMGGRGVGPKRTKASGERGSPIGNFAQEARFLLSA